MKKNLVKGIKSLALLSTAAVVLTSCGGSGGGGSTSTYGKYTSPYITASGFVNALNNVDPISNPLNYIDKTEAETLRNDGRWFVYYDAEYDHEVAVDLNYLRSIAYWDYYSSNNNLAREFRNIQLDDEIDYGDIGDLYGDYYEPVDVVGYDYGTNEFIYEGVWSGELYEDETETTDTGLLAAQSEDTELFDKASSYSVAFKLPAKKALELVTMEKEVKRMLKSASAGELLEEDQKAITKNIEHFTGKTMAEFEAAKEDAGKREQLIEEVSAHLGTPGSNLENVILPELLSIDL
ncbi:hypothetical protein [Bacteriovorax sp. DB6_IX]|uniref:hypothetical protein n=1 Tax=Bacteriovorax sp. DB6_IX TaxID=1353530 RepID=UPI00038A006B|nr:hypothetical protein [Bacteriovorax sp. DB6_IX]EQC52250.1 putative lipoprotein [Bacteriovorax sp. DB6_IX]